MGEACGSDSLSVVSGADIEVIHRYSATIGNAVLSTSEAIQQFLDWMNTQQRPSQWFRQVAIEFDDGLRQSLAGKSLGHIRNVQRTVWQIIETPGWIFHTANQRRNADANVRALKSLEEFASQKPESVTEVDEVSDSLHLCTKCKKRGSLVICSSQFCLNRYHWKCSGLKSNEVGDGDYFCQECNPNFVAGIQAKRVADVVAGGKNKKRRKSHQRPSKGGNKSKTISCVPEQHDGESETLDSNSDDACVHGGAGGPATEAHDTSDSAVEPCPAPCTLHPATPAPISRLISSSGHDDITSSSSSSSRKAKGTASIEQFFWSTLSTDNEFCLLNLERLSHVPEISDEFESRLKSEVMRLLRSRCVGLFNFYDNVGFLKLHDDAVSAIDVYAGKQQPFDSAFLLEQLKEYAFVVTPRMWTGLEIALIMFLLLDPNLHYLNINQKNRAVQEETQNR
jgi:hypothetical protein